MNCNKCMHNINSNYGDRRLINKLVIAVIIQSVIILVLLFCLLFTIEKRYDRNNQNKYNEIYGGGEYVENLIQ